ncbi:MAG: glycosyltransferase [Treponema sp.]|nr:glycosyltransferase [Treponema sp.]
MKSYFFILTYFAGGGTEKVFENVSKVINEKIGNSKIYLFVVNGFNSEKYPVEKFVNVIKSKTELKKIAKSEKNKLVVNFSGDWKSAFVSRQISKDYISWVHQNPLTMKTARTAFINFYLLKKSKRIVCVCKEQKEILENEFGFKNQIEVIYNSVDFEKVKKLSLVPLENIDFNYILMVARLDFNSKDFFTVIKAYCQLPYELQKKYRLIFLGSGPDEQKIINYVENSVPVVLKANIILAGFDKNPYHWIKNASLNILSSKTEGFGVSIIEGMCLECPEILTNYKTGAKEISENGKNSALIPIGDYNLMENAIEKILIDENYKNELLKNASNFVKRFYQSELEKDIVNFFREF